MKERLIVPARVADEPEPHPRKEWPSHNHDPREVERPEPTRWLRSLEGAEATTPQDAWQRGETLHRAFPRLTRTPIPAASALSSEEAARLEARFAETRRKRKVLVRVALLMVWGALLVTLAVLYIVAK